MNKEQTNSDKDLQRAKDYWIKRIEEIERRQGVPKLPGQEPLF